MSSRLCATELSSSTMSTRILSTRLSGKRTLCARRKGSVNPLDQAVNRLQPQAFLARLRLRLQERAATMRAELDGLPIWAHDGTIPPTLGRFRGIRRLALAFRFLRKAGADPCHGAT